MALLNTSGSTVLVASGHSGDGQIRLEAPKPWTLYVHVRASGALQGFYRDTTLAVDTRGSNSGITLHLERATGKVRVTPTDSLTGKSVAGASIVFLGPVNSTLEPGVDYELPWGYYTVAVTAPYYEAYTTTVYLQPGALVQVNASLDRVRVPVTLTVVDGDSGCPPASTVTATAFSGESGDAQTASGAGNLTLALRVDEEYTVTISTPGYREVTLNVKPGESPASLTVTLHRLLVTVRVEVRDGATGAYVTGPSSRSRARQACTPLKPGPTGWLYSRRPGGPTPSRPRPAHTRTTRHHSRYHRLEKPAAP